MSNKLISQIALAALVAFVAGAPALAQGMEEATGGLSLDQIIAKNIESRGGMDALKAVESAQLSGTMVMGGGMEAPFTFRFKRPNQARLEFEFQGMTGIQAYDGEVGWGVMPFMGKTEPEALADDQLKQIKDQSDIDGHFVDFEDKGHEIELLGMEEVEGTEAYKLKITKENGDVVHSFLDTDYFLEFRNETRQDIQGAQQDVVITLGDYKEVGGGVLMAHSIEAKVAAMQFTQTITFNEVAVNVEVDDGIFTMPEVTKPAVETPEKEEPTEKNSG